MGNADRQHRVVAGVLVACLTLVACHSTSDKGSVAAPGPGDSGRVVVRFNGGLPSDSYVVTRPAGGDQTSLNIRGFRLAGFTKDLRRAAIADNGTVGSGPLRTVVSVSPVGSVHSTPVWTVDDDLTTAPAWNPAGTKLAFGMQPIADRGGQSPGKALPVGLWTIGADGHSPKLLVPGGIVGNVAWSPDGSQIAFVRSAAEAKLETVKSSGGTPTELATLGTDVEPSLAWSPDGEVILVAQSTFASRSLERSGLVAYPVGGGNPNPVIPLQSDRDYTGVAYSPDGSQIAFSVVSSATVGTPGTTSATTSAVSQGAGRGSALFLANADGSNARQAASFDSIGLVMGWVRG